MIAEMIKVGMRVRSATGLEGIVRERGTFGCHMCEVRVEFVNTEKGFSMWRWYDERDLIVCHQDTSDSLSEALRNVE